ncbi:hypothetical protein PR048_025200 [Dryococelus australis]|uniref:Uncharacterized protein n=1 Tax=Dryococelus australis TaxID=614101 RepID=A0ABQ9GQL6_9NEOP|nr:hypothetical protein PR048_025200 [Dryococelus australis]
MTPSNLRRLCMDKKTGASEQVGFKTLNGCHIHQVKNLLPASIVDCSPAKTVGHGSIKNLAGLIVPIIETVILCARQGIALRGHRDHGPFDVEQEPEENGGNFKSENFSGRCCFKNAL